LHEATQTCRIGKSTRIQVLFLYMSSVIKPIFVCVVIGSCVELMNYVGSRKILYFSKNHGLSFQI